MIFKGLPTGPNYTRSVTKQKQRSRIFKFLVQHHPKKSSLTFCGFPEWGWCFEKMLFTQFPGQVTALGVERSYPVFQRAKIFMPGALLPEKSTQKLVKTDVACLYFGEFETLQKELQETPNSFPEYRRCTAMWLDHMSSISVPYLKQLRSLKLLLHPNQKEVPLVLTVTKGREAGSVREILSVLGNQSMHGIIGNQARIQLMVSAIQATPGLEFEERDAWTASSSSKASHVKMLYLAGVIHQRCNKAEKKVND